MIYRGKFKDTQTAQKDKPKSLYKSTLQEKPKDIETAQKDKPTMSVYTHCWFLRIQKSRTDEKVKVFARPGDIILRS